MAETKKGTKVKKMAEETYNGVISGTDSALVNASCDFKLLEDAENPLSTKKFFASRSFFVEITFGYIAIIYGKHVVKA